ncbi:uncharacterized protein BX663DRAFT_505394 [Cokeromyces recurvatus]|uniref:uncharacterized protein n=1 Tax=Cokeromyces recurvatus TaxID=90255 RepID=UPI0022208ECD|nr:uncharacterized protein BX663DRAFT_505394 [Cokeromyces recurvatus]KAI7903833.1 hypothetical protein BX663DRAFT_505394 [Cokeromyces recurvatus]
MLIKQQNKTKSSNINDNNQQQISSDILVNNRPLNAINNERTTERLKDFEKRTAHNALERHKREGLNSKFQELAHVLPSLQQIQRPSKSTIVAKSLEFVSKAKERETDFNDRIQALRKENEQLMRQASRAEKRIRRRLEHEKVMMTNNKQQATVFMEKSSFDQANSSLEKQKKDHEGSSRTKKEKVIKSVITLSSMANASLKRIREPTDALNGLMIDTTLPTLKKKRGTKKMETFSCTPFSSIQASSSAAAAAGSTMIDLVVNDMTHAASYQAMNQSNLPSYHHSHSSSLTDKIINHSDLLYNSMSLPLSSIHNTKNTDELGNFSESQQSKVSPSADNEPIINYNNNVKYIVSSIPATKTPIGTGHQRQNYNYTPTTSSFDIFNTCMQNPNNWH